MFEIIIISATTQDRMYIHKANSKVFTQVLNFITWHTFIHALLNLDIQLSQSSSLHAC